MGCLKVYPRRQCGFTDNAQVGRRIVPVNSRVQGIHQEIRFKGYEPRKKGATPSSLSRRCRYAAQCRSARADYQNALAGRSVADRSVGVAAANVAVSEASIAEAKVLMENAAVDLERYRKLLAKDAVTRQQYDGARNRLEGQEGTL